MQILINGDSIELDEHTSIAQLLDQLVPENSRVAVELNREIIPRSEHPTKTLKAGDKLEIIQAIGGG